MANQDIKKPRIIALTGSIGSGKTTAAEEFKKLGAYIIDADILAREAVMPGSQTLNSIAAIFGGRILNIDGSLNRKALGTIVFSDSDQRKKLEAITHPRIRELFQKKLSALRSEKNPAQLIIYVVPLLFESGNRYPEVEKIIVVSAPREVCIGRIMRRDALSREEASKRCDSQLPISQKELLADYVIQNMDETNLAPQVEDIYKALTP